MRKIILTINLSIMFSLFFLSGPACTGDDLEEDIQSCFFEVVSVYPNTDFELIAGFRGYTGPYFNYYNFYYDVNNKEECFSLVKKEECRKKITATYKKCSLIGEKTHCDEIYSKVLPAKIEVTYSRGILGTEDFSETVFRCEYFGVEK